MKQALGMCDQREGWPSAAWLGQMVADKSPAASARSAVWVQSHADKVTFQSLAVEGLEIDVCSFLGFIQQRWLPLGSGLPPTATPSNGHLLQLLLQKGAHACPFAPQKRRLGFRSDQACLSLILPCYGL